MPSATLSSTGRLRKSVVIWNVRPRPRRTRARLRRAGHVLAAEQYLPGRGREPARQHVDERRLARAVRPDKRVARSRLERKSMLSATVSAPKLLHSFLVSKEYIENSEDPAPREQHHDDQQHSDAEVPVLGILLGEIVLRDQVDDRPDERAVEAADAAEDQHDQDVARGLEAEHVEPDELVHLREQRAGDAAMVAEMV